MKNSILGIILLTFFLAFTACNNKKKSCEGAGAMGDSTNTCCKKDDMKACCKIDSTGTCIHDSTTCASSESCGKHHGAACDPEKEGCCKKGDDHKEEGKACCKKKE